MKRQIAFDWVLIAAIGLVIQAFWLGLLKQPTYMDAFYYTTNGQRLAEGYGFTESVIWQFLDNPPSLPAPSHTYWMPLPSLLAATGYLIKGDFNGAQIPFWLLGGLLPTLAYSVSRQLSGHRWQAWVTALFTAAGGYYAAFFSQPTTFAPFAWAGGFCLLALGMSGRDLPASTGSGETTGDGRPGNRRLWWFLAGLAAGAGHLTRADGLLLVLIGLAVWARETIVLWVKGKEQPGVSDAALRQRRDQLLGLLLFISAYGLIMGGWYLRNWLVIGQPLPSAGAQSMFLTTYDDLFAYNRSFNMNTLAAWGWTNILQSRLQGLWFALQTLAVIPGLIFLVPFIFTAIVSHYKKPSRRQFLRPAIWFGLAIFLSASLIFTFPGMRGMLFHSSVALWPWSTALATSGIGIAVDWAANRLPHWQPERAKRLFSAMFVAVAFVLSLVVSFYRVQPIGEAETFSQTVALIPSNSIMMVGNAPAFYYYTGMQAVSIPNEPVEVLLDAADRYKVTHVLLDENRPLPLNDLYLGNEKEPRLKLLIQIDDSKLYEIMRSGE